MENNDSSHWIWTSHEYLNLKWNGKYKARAIFIQYHSKVILLKSYQTVYKFKILHLKTRNREHSILLLKEIIGKIKVKKVLHVKCTSITGIAKIIAMIDNNKCLLIRQGESHWFCWSVDLKTFKQNRKKWKISRKMPSDCFKWLTQTIIQKCLKFLDVLL